MSSMRFYVHGLFLLIIQFSPVLGLASLGEGGVETHGGDGVVCNGKPLQILDYYEAALPDLSGQPAVLDVDNMSYEQVLGTVMARLRPTRIWKKFEASYAAVGDINLWKVVDLNDVKDTEQLYPLPPGCRLKQAAARRGHVVFIDKEVAQIISRGQLAVLSLHETIFAMYDNYGASRTRAILGALLMRDFEAERLASQLIWVDDFLFPYEKFFKGVYQLQPDHEIQRLKNWFVKIESVDMRAHTIKIDFYSVESTQPFGAIVFSCEKLGNVCHSQKGFENKEKPYDVEIESAVLNIHPLTERASLRILKGSLDYKRLNKRTFQLNRADL